jgi:hypothetical protein
MNDDVDTPGDRRHDKPAADVLPASNGSVQVLR